MHDAISSYWDESKKQLEAINFSLSIKKAVKLTSDTKLPIANANKLLVIPLYAESPVKGKLFLGGFWAKVTDGTLSAYEDQPLPWINAGLLETNSHLDFTLATKQKVEQTYQLEPACWDEDEHITLRQQLDYADKYFNEVFVEGWREILAENNYKVADGRMVLELEDVPKEKDPKLIRALINKLSDEQYLDEDFDEEHSIKQNDLIICAADDFILNSQQRKILTNMLGMEQEILSIDALPGSGKTTVIKNFVANIWARAALEDKLPEAIETIRQNHALLETKKLSIFSVASKKDCWINYNTDSLEDDFKRCFVASKYFDGQNKGLVEIKNILQSKAKNLHKHIQTKLNSYELQQRTKLDYALRYKKDGGIKNKLAEIEKQLTIQEEKCRELQVIKSMHERQEAESYGFLSSITNAFGQGKKFKHIYDFFAEHFPEENIKKLNVTKLKKKIKQMQEKSLRSLHMLEDIKHQVLSDRHQLDVINSKSINEDDLDKGLCHELFLLVLHFWEADYILGLKSNQQQERQQKNVLIIENAEDISSFFAKDLFKYKKIIFLGDLSFKHPTTLVPYAIKEQLLIKNDLLEVADELPENILECAFILSENKLSLTKPLNWQYNFYQCYCDLLSMPVVHDFPNNAVIEKIDTRGVKSLQQGGYINKEEVSECCKLIKDLPKHEVAIYTTTKQQAKLIKASLSNPVYVLDPLEGDQQRYKIVVLSLVFTLEDKGKLPFDAGGEVLAKLCRAVKEKLVLIGDLRLLDDKTHSPSGKLAKNLFSEDLKKIALPSVEELL